LVRPDFVIVLGDDLGVGECSPYSPVEVATPHLARLASEGMRFDRAYVASPSCGQSRASLLSGLMPARHGAVYNHQPARRDALALLPLLSAAGYDVVGIGKVAHGPEREA
jgi:uncharacterized sulfatase